jgi:type II secretory pathway pseudopilin PulG
MHLRGQERSSWRLQGGYAMAAFLVAMSVMAIVLTMAMPVWKTVVKREKEAELIWRASQYARAVALFQRKYANAYPPNLDILLNEKFLRKKYKDPITNDDFLLVPASQQAGLPGQSGPPPAQPGQPSPGQARGGIVGVVSKSKETGLRLFNGRSKYSEWVFTPETVGNLIGMKPANAPGRQPGSTRPGGVGPGNNMPGGPSNQTRPGVSLPPRRPPN